MDNITFTAEQKEQLKNNVRAIEHYIEEPDYARPERERKTRKTLDK